MPKTTLSELKDYFSSRYSFWTNKNGNYDYNYDNPRFARVQRIRNTVNTPGFRQLRTRKRPNGLPHNSFSYTEHRFHYPYGVAWQESGPPGDRTRLTIVGIIPFVDFHDENPVTDSMKDAINTQALNKSLTDLKGMKVNLGVAFQQRKLTSNLILGTASKLAGAYKFLRAGNLGGVANSLGLTKSQVSSTLGRVRRRSSTSNVTKTLSSEWLALQYGWKPLISDVYNSAEQLAAMSDVRRIQLVSSKTARGFHSSRVTWYNVPNVTRIAQGRYTRKYTYVFSHSSEILKDLSKWGVTNPASVAWEVLPWSFVFDWFIPLGNYIDNWDATLGLTFEKGSLTTFDKYTVQFKAAGIELVDGTTFSCHGDGRIEHVFCTRSPLGGFPLPNLPSFLPHLTQNRGISAVALLRQRLKL